MSRLRELIAALVSVSLLIAPAWSASPTSLGTVVYADRAHMVPGLHPSARRFLAAIG